MTSADEKVVFFTTAGAQVVAAKFSAARKRIDFGVMFGGKMTYQAKGSVRGSTRQIGKIIKACQ
jgi:hypothetical protein